ncbi:hypothetical protein ACET3X_004988 [Alternaria dauci]|uniref:Uncharacterized protein n=1 Tax=Alternaria dauci TaxID=48095 RepID=A0ABR3UIZ6_9PLEO
MAELNGGQLAVLLQNWNHPVIRPFLATAAAGLAAITVYEKGLPLDIDIKRLNHFIAHLAAPELGRGLYIPKKYMSPNHPSNEIFGILEPELFSVANITARTNTRLQTTSDVSTIIHHIGNDSTHVHFQTTSHFITSPPVLSFNTSGAPHTTTTLPIDTQAQNAGIVGNGGVLGLAAAGLIATGAFFVRKKYSNYKKAKAQKLTDEQLIAHLMIQLEESKASKLTDAQCISRLELQLDEVTASKVRIETVLKAAQKDVSICNEERNRLQGELLVSSILNSKLVQRLHEAKAEMNQNAKLVDDIIKRLEKSTAMLEEDRNIQMQTNSQLQDELSKAQSEVIGLRNEQLQADRLEMDGLVNELRSVGDEKTKLLDQLAASEAAANATRQRMSNKIDDLDRQIVNYKLLSLEAEEKSKEQVATTEVLRQEAREANMALDIAREKISRLEKEKTASDFPEPSISETGGEDNDDDDLDRDITGSTEGSQQPGLQQEAHPSNASESPSNSVDADEEQSQMSTKPPVPSSSELNIPRRKKRELWYVYWRDITSKLTYSDDKVHELELPCFDVRFSHIGLVCPAEDHEDRTLESGKVVEHTKCNLCLQWYTKKDMYDHLKTCKAFWEFAIRCGHCKKIFKYNTAFFDKHAPDCKTQAMEEDHSDEHFTLAKSEVDATTAEISRQASPSSMVFITPEKQINPAAPPFTPGGSTSGHARPIPTGPRFTGPNFQQGRGRSFNSPQSPCSPRNTPYMTLHGILPTHGTGFGTRYPAACPPNGPQAYSAPHDNSQAHRYPGPQHQGHPQNPHNFSPSSPGYTPRK